MESCFSIYDIAIRDKLLAKIPGKVLVAPVERALEERHSQLAENREEIIEGIELPFISLWRTGDSNNLEAMYNEAMFRKGMNIGVTTDGVWNRVKRLHMLPTKLTYSFELWSVDKVVLDELYREFLFTILANPSVVIEVSGARFIYSLEMQDEEDNTDISAFAQNQKLYRRTIVMTIPQARIHMLEETKVPRGMKIAVSANKVPEGIVGYGITVDPELNNKR